MTPFETRRDVQVDGSRIAVFQAGDGEPCLLLHGYPQTHDCWAPIVGRLAKTHAVFAPDWVGWGASRLERDLPTYDREVGRIAQLIDALGLQRVNLIAHDYGAHIGLSWAMANPNRLTRLAVLNSRAHLTFPPMPYALFAAYSWAARSFPLFTRLPHHWAHRLVLAEYRSNGSWSAADMERYLAFLKDAQGLIWLQDFYACYQTALRPAMREGCRAIRAPTAIIWADKDPFNPISVGRDLAAIIPGAQLTVLEGAGHFLIEQRPAEVMTAIERLLARAAIVRPV